MNKTITRNCMICGQDMAYYFSKRFDCYGLDTVDYVRCPNCEFVASDTHFSLTDDEWSRLNTNYHESYQHTDQNLDDPNWLSRLQHQARVISELHEVGLLTKESEWLDYGCGDGKLGELLASHGHPINNFDRYMGSGAPHFLTESELAHKRFDLVVNTSVFEHVRATAPLDEMVNLLSASGVLATHTFVSRQVPQDPAWFYLLPVHCAFFSNGSMERLFKKWGFACSLYNLDARMWFFFRQGSQDLMTGLRQLEQRGGYFYKDGFADYW